MAQLRRKGLLVELHPEACYLGRGMQMGTLAIVRPPTTGDQELVLRLTKGFEDASLGFEVYSSPELCALVPENLPNITLLVASPSQCIETSGDQEAFLSQVACARRRILATAAPVESPGYRGRLRSGIDFDAVFDVGFVSQRERHGEVSDVPYHFVFNGLIRDEEPVAEEPSHPEERTIPWVLTGPRSEGNKNLLAELFEHKIDRSGLCLLQSRTRSRAGVELLPGSRGLLAVLSKARYYLWGSDRDVPYYESFRFSEPLLAGTVPCKVDPELAAEGLDIPGLYVSVAAFQAAVREEGYLAMYRRARDFYISGGRLAEHLSGALSLV
jgi:hypothetical protein